MKRRLAILVFLCLTILLSLLFPSVWRRAILREDGLPPGISAPSRQLLRIWLVNDTVSASSWLKRQAARLESSHRGISVYLRSAQPQELSAPDAVMPDLILFGPGALKAPESLLVPITGDFPLSDDALRAGRWQGMQYAVPVCLDGYALAFDPALTGTAAATPAPTPILGIGAGPTASPKPEEEASLAALLAGMSAPAKGKTLATGIQCAAGMPLMLLCELSGGQAGIPPALRPASFAAASQDTVLADFLQGKHGAAVLNARQLRTLAARGKAFALLPMPLPATDMYLSAGIVQGGNQNLAMTFLTALLSKEAQQDLAASGLFPASSGVSLYGSDPVFSAMEGSLQGMLVLPNAFAYDEEGLKGLSRGAFSNGGNISDIFESIR